MLLYHGNIKMTQQTLMFGKEKSIEEYAKRSLILVLYEGTHHQRMVNMSMLVFSNGQMLLWNFHLVLQSALLVHL